MGERWSCPGRLCGTYQGYQRGCRRTECAAAVPVQSSRRRAAKEPTGRRAPIDDTVKAEVVTLLRRGGTLSAAAQAAGVSEDRLRSARRRDPAWDAAVRAAAGRRLERPRFADGDAYLAELRAGRTVEEAAARIGWEYTAIYYRRLTDPEFDAAVVQAAIEGSPAGRPGPRPRPVHRLNLEGDRR